MMWRGLYHLLPSGGLSQCLDTVVIGFLGLLVDRKALESLHLILFRCGWMFSGSLR